MRRQTVLHITRTVLPALPAEHTVVSRKRLEKFFKLGTSGLSKHHQNSLIC